MDVPARDDELPSASLETLERRAQLQRAIRQFFDERGYLEIETPILSTEMISDAWLEPFVAGWTTDPQRWSNGGELRYLQTSPEAHMKRLLVAGATAIYQFSRVFRNGETGRRHNPEFTMLEWYRVGDDHHQQMDFVEELVKSAFLASSAWRMADSPALSAARFLRMTYDDAFAQYAGRRVLDSSMSELQAIARQHRLTPPQGLDEQDRDGWLNFLLAELVEPRLGREQPTFLYHYPASQAALARVSSSGHGNVGVAERFELYVHGVELCNGYHELTDAETLASRTREQARLRADSGLRPLPAPDRLLRAMQVGLPESTGVALGWDRLVMLALEKPTLADVIAFPFDRA
ncbi:MAG: EF-P lysine aminoacylase EpmA [Planctomycetaceae bacterium]